MGLYPFENRYFVRAVAPSLSISKAVGISPALPPLGLYIPADFFRYDLGGFGLPIKGNYFPLVIPKIAKPPAIVKAAGVLVLKPFKAF